MHHRREHRFWIFSMGRSLFRNSWPRLNGSRHPEGNPVTDGQFALITNRASWDEQTSAYPQVGRAGWLTPAQAQRTRGGRA